MSKLSKSEVSHIMPSTAESGKATATKFARNKTEGAHTRVECRFVDDCIRRCPALIAELFQTRKKNISSYVKNVLAESGLRAEATAKDYLTFQTKGTRQVRCKVQLYTLDLILAKKGTHNAA